MKFYRGIIIMNDGSKMPLLKQKSEPDVVQSAREQMKMCNRYYRKNGIDYGKSGKLFTYEEEHNGLKELVIVEYTETDRKIITKL